MYSIEDVEKDLKALESDKQNALINVHRFDGAIAMLMMIRNKHYATASVDVERQVPVTKGEVGLV